MMAKLNPPRWFDALKGLRGRLTLNAPLSGITWFGVGGPAEAMFRPADAEDLAACLAALPTDVPVTVIGVGSNLLVRDGGVSGVVIRLGRGFAEISADNTLIRAGSGALDLNVATIAADAGISGMEFLSGVPGTIGGALVMNAGAYDGEIAQIVEHAVAIDRAGARHVLAGPDFGFRYRGSAVPADWIFVEASLRGQASTAEAVRARVAEIRATREAAQPIRAKTGGSTFKNPPGLKAWQLIDQAGCRGLTLGGAVVSDKHCNFLINRSDATAAEIEDLGEDVRRRVFETSGVMLDWEIRRIGERA